MTTDFSDPLDEVEKLLRSVRKDIKAAQNDDEVSFDLLEKLRGRELQAQRLRSQIIANNRKLTVRILDSPEWEKLATSIVDAVKDCDSCSKTLLEVLEAHKANV